MLKYWVWLAELPGLKGPSRLALLRHFGSPEDIFFADREELLLAEDVPPGQAELALNRDLSAADRILADCQRLGQRILTIQDAEYPQRLRNIFDPPLVLYVKGRMPAIDEEAAIAVVGTRECTPYGVASAERLSQELAASGAVVVTGLAKGVDAAAARGALRAGGTVVGVTGNGLDVYYPWESRDLYDDVAAAGVLLSEYPPGSEPEKHHFPARNRIMSGLSVAALVVEAPERSGAYHRPAGPGAGPGGLRRPRSHRCSGQRGLQPPDPGRRRPGGGGLGHPPGFPGAFPGKAAPRREAPGLDAPAHPAAGRAPAEAGTCPGAGKSARSPGREPGGPDGRSDCPSGGAGAGGAHSSGRFNRKHRHSRPAGFVGPDHAGD